MGVSDCITAIMSDAQQYNTHNMHIKTQPHKHICIPIYKHTINKRQPIANSCTVCQWVQDVNSLLYRELAPHPVPKSHFNMWTMDFVTGLPLDGGFNRLIVCVEKLTKLTGLSPYSVG